MWECVCVSGDTRKMVVRRRRQERKTRDAQTERKSAGKNLLECHVSADASSARSAGRADVELSSLSTPCLSHCPVFKDFIPDSPLITHRATLTKMSEHSLCEIRPSMVLRSERSANALRGLCVVIRRLELARHKPSHLFSFSCVIHSLHNHTRTSCS